MNIRNLLRGLSPLLLALLLSCGGGGDSGSGAASSAASAGTGSTTSTIASAGSTTLEATGGADTGSSTSSDSGSTTTASSGDGSGVGSGGTGISTADAATSVGAVDGMGSIIVNGLRYNVDNATLSLSDATELQIGMSIAVTGPVDASFSNGVATRLTSAAELRGPVTSVDPAAGSFVVMGTQVILDDATVWADLPGVASLTVGSNVQVWGLPASPGVLSATRVQQQVSNPAPIVTGTVQQLDSASGTFMLGNLTVAYGSANLSGGLANGMIVRVRADAQTTPGLLTATQVEAWYPIPTVNGLPVHLEGVITNYTSLGAFQVLGQSVDASGAQVTGGTSSKINNDVKVQVGGTLVNGVLVASELKIRHIPGAGALPSYTLIGSVGNYVSPASFRVRGQLVDASGPGVLFVNGTRAALANSVNVTVVGTRIVNGALMADQVSFN
ncbi:hypothetical protein VAR608DRAFT_6648 [Variovorax sp. HW608]|uniref:DUF5666 domain-containing protein n=1 Tax=Variovorax sp. HW608 TaxID=1034889 RepID=UPI00081FA8A9|nr:DUF5666 domain-containing protein [Variovorax sp. HW608]SCK60248.1 hypothetical protein VAR608DRAFT_6648 [Variovorax sp. HW608]